MIDYFHFYFFDLSLIFLLSSLLFEYISLGDIFCFTKKSILQKKSIIAFFFFFYKLLF